MKNFTSLRTTATVLFVLLLANSCNKSIQQPEGELRFRSENVHLVSEATARLIAENFNPEVFFGKASGSGGQVRGDKVQEEHFPGDAAGVPGITAGRSNIKKLTKFLDHSGLPAFYTFSFENNKGFLIVSADSGMRPILAYVPKGEFDEKTIPGGLTEWISKTTNNVEIARQGLVDTRKNILAWKNHERAMVSPGAVKHTGSQSAVAVNGLRVNIPPPNSNPCDDPYFTDYSEVSVGPLLPTEWGQFDGYNDGLGVGPCTPLFTNGHYPTGCVATAMAQVMRYWQWPNSYSYNLMSSSSGNIYVRQLMEDAGSSVNMVYTCSGSYPYSSPAALVIRNALTNIFYYSSASYGAYSQSGFDYLTIKSNISNSRPVILIGAGSAGQNSHCWVADGWLEASYWWCDGGNLAGCTYLLFHMNWGRNEVWSSNPNTSYNGWYAYDNWSISAINQDYNYYNSFVYNIHP